MKGDFSRNSFNSRKRYSGVLMQQGRVQLDADWNEQLQIASHRTETEAIDTIGLCGVPKGSDSFKLEIVQDDLAIRPGRIYVDGLLCELESTPVPIDFIQNQDQQVSVHHMTVDGTVFQAGQWLEVSADGQAAKLLRITGTDEAQKVLELSASIAEYRNKQNASVRRIATYTSQPDYLSPQFATAPDPDNGVLSNLGLADGTYIAYLHVWQEHVTALDDPLIREKALGGPDTATRIKNVWQVELLGVTQNEKGGGGDKSPEVASCETQFKQYDDLIAPSTGRMNARTHFVEDPKNPCVLPPSSGYQRLENQLYRVEIQKGGKLGVATFKWSRENGSILTTIEKVQGSTLTVTDVGKDEFLSFINGGWAEIIETENELKGEPHTLVHISSVNPATREIELDSLDAGFETKTGLKLRRWDQEGENLQDGIVAEDNWTPLEGGVEVRFSNGKYKAGDYWMIPARTATGEIEWPPFETPNLNPLPQSPAGIGHHYCRLALVEQVGGKANIVDDCRKEFPPLTHICAEDVCFDNTECQMPNVETVQDAIERLCDRNDLRFHNRHLHGWGIVCGLEVNCGPDGRQTKRRHVTVKPGYAIDCMGNDVLIKQDAPLDLLTMIQQYNDAHPNDPLFDPANANGGEVCLYLTGEAGQPFALDKYDPKQNTLQSLLKGTLLMDFYKDCIEKLVDFFIDEFTAKPEESKLPVGPTQKRFTTLLNLLIQFVNPATGQYVYLSGEKGKEDEKTEHTILLNFYERLLALLQSHTFCAMFEGARPFPDYPFATTGMRTLFGKNFHTRLRIHPQGKMAFTCGSNDKIHVYDLTGEEMVAVIDFPGGKAAIVQDVAFSVDGKQLYAVGLLNNKDTMFAVADISTTAEGGKFDFKWRTPTVICDVLLITLTTTTKVKDKVFAVGKNKGLYDINPDNVNATPQPMYPFNATGQITTLDQTGRAFAAAAASTAGNVDEYDRVLSLNLNLKEATPPTLVLANPTIGAFKGSDDLEVVALKGQDAVRLYVVVNGPQSSSDKLLILADATKMTFNSIVDLQESTEIRLAFNPTTQRLMLTYEDNYHVRTLDDKEQLERTFRLPVQIDPIDVAASPDGKRVYVLNHTSNTITTVQAERVDPKAQLDLEVLARYRREIIEAFADLLGGFLQYLKDCFCDHFLVRCPPECTPEDKLYLACIRIKDNQVFKVCNFSRRKYVKSFPTVGYWLSLFPAIPFISRAVEIFCCSVLPNFFGKFKAPQVTEGGQNRVKGKDIRSGVAIYQQTDVRSMLSEQLGKVKLGGKLLSDSLTQKYTERFKTEKTVTPPPAAVKQNEVVGKTTDEAKTRLAANKVNVTDVQPYDRSKAAGNLIRLAEAPHSLEAGTNITLFEENGVVKYYAPAEEVPAPVRNFLREEIKANTVEMADTTAIRADVKTLQLQLADTQKQHEASLAERDSQIAILRANVAEVAAARPAAEDTQVMRVQLADLQKQLATVQKTHADALAARDQQITELRTNIQTFTANKEALTQTAAMREQVASLQLQMNNMQKTNADALAARDQQIAQLRTATEGVQKKVNLGGITLQREGRAPRKGAAKKGKGKKSEGEEKE